MICASCCTQVVHCLRVRVPSLCSQHMHSTIQAALLHAPRHIWQTVIPFGGATALVGMPAVALPCQAAGVFVMSAVRLLLGMSMRDC